MLRLCFSGWFQCRLATDPDPYDELDGVSGTTVALAWEPRLDRVIRLNDAMAPRSHAAPIEVLVRSVWSGDDHRSEHPLHGARVDLCDGALFEGRNGLVADDGLEPIAPFILRVSGGGVVLQREDPPGPWPPGAVPEPLDVAHRFGGGVESSAAAKREVLDAIGVSDPEAWAKARLRNLRAEEEATSDEGRRAGVRTRREMDPGLAPVRVTYRFSVGQRGGSGVLEDPGGRISEPLDLLRAWPLEFWMGGWDADGMCGFVKGELRVPLREP